MILPAPSRSCAAAGFLVCGFTLVASGEFWVYRIDCFQFYFFIIII